MTTSHSEIYTITAFVHVDCHCYIHLGIRANSMDTKKGGEVSEVKFGGRNKFLWTREPLGLPIYPQTGYGDYG